MRDAMGLGFGRYVGQSLTASMAVSALSADDVPQVQLAMRCETDSPCNCYHCLTVTGTGRARSKPLHDLGQLVRQSLVW